MQTIWFALWGILWAVYFMLDGFDLGLGSMTPILARGEKDRRTILYAMGPFWNGNEVWLITAGGVMFAAFPTAYAVMFSSMYSALMLILFGLIVRGAAFEFRNQSDNPAWRSLWDKCQFVGSFVPALLFGVAFANIFKGIPIDGQGVYKGTLLTLLNPYGLLGGVLFVLLFTVHGSIWLAIKSDGQLHARAARWAGRLWVALLAAAVAFLVATAFATNLYHNYLKLPVLFLIPAIMVAALVTTRVFIAKACWWKAWFASSAVIVSATLFGVAGIYPNLLPSSLNAEYSLTIVNSSSSPLTLKIMLVVVLIFIPIVVIYQSCVYNMFKHKVTEHDLSDDEAY